MDHESVTLVHLRAGAFFKASLTHGHYLWPATGGNSWLSGVLDFAKMVYCVRSRAVAQLGFSSL